MRTVEFIENPNLQRVILNTGKKIGGNNITVQELVRAAYTVEAILALDMNNTEVVIQRGGNEANSTLNTNNTEVTIQQGGNVAVYDITQYRIPTTLKWMTEVRGVTRDGLAYEPLLFHFTSSKPDNVVLMTPQEMFEFGIRWFANYKSDPQYFTLEIPVDYTPLANVMDRIVYNGRVKSTFNGILPIELNPQYVELTERTFVYCEDVIMAMMAALTTYYSTLVSK